MISTPKNPKRRRNILIFLRFRTSIRWRKRILDQKFRGNLQWKKEYNRNWNPTLETKPENAKMKGTDDFQHVIILFQYLTTIF